MNLRKVLTGQKVPSRGAAITECAVAIPLLALLMILTFEIGRVFSQYLSLTQIAYEGARAGSQIKLTSTSAGCFNNFAFDDLEMMMINGTDVTDNPHWQVQSRVHHLIELQGTNVTVTCDTTRPNNHCNDEAHPQFANWPTIMAEYIPPATAAQQAAAGCTYPTEHQNTYAIKVRGMYKGLLIPVKFAITVESRTRILTTNQDFSSELNGHGSPPPTPTGGEGAGGLGTQTTVITFSEI